MSIENPNEVPEQWWPYFRKQGMDGLTFRELSRKVDGVAVTTVVRALTGEGQPTRRVIAKIAPALGMTEDRFRQVRADVMGARHHEPFQLPQRADELTDRERELITGMVHALLDARDHHDQADQSSPDSAGSSPAPRAQGAEVEKNNVRDLRRSESSREACIDRLDMVAPPPEVAAEWTPEDPADAKAARTRDPRFRPDIPDDDGIGEENQDQE